jgi:integrase
VKAKITKRQVEKLQPGQIISDTEVRGFVARCLPSGTVQYGFRYRARETGKRRWLAIGSHGNVTPDQARKQAQKAAANVIDRKDPLAERHQSRDRVLQSRSVADVLDEFVEKYVVAQGLRSEREIRRIFEKYVKPDVGHLPIEEIRRSTVTAMLDRIDQDHGPVMADRVRAHLSKAFNWHEVRTDEFRSPIVRGMSRVKHKERARKRILSTEEIQVLWQALEDLPKPSATLVKLLLLTGQRRSEVGGMRWQDIDGDLWTIPVEMSKTKQTQTVPLSHEARALLENLPKDGPYVFGRNGTTPFSGYSKLKAALNAELERRWTEIHDTPMEPWVFHDLRRTARSLLAAAGVRREVAERVLGHTIQGVEGVYDRHEYTEEKRDALERLADAIMLVVAPTPPNVVQLKPKEIGGPSA